MEQSSKLIRWDTEDNVAMKWDEEDVLTPLLRLLKNKKPVLKKENIESSFKHKSLRRATFTSRKSQDFTVIVGNLDMQSKRNLGSLNPFVKKSKTRKRLMTIDGSNLLKNSKVKSIKKHRSNLRIRAQSWKRLKNNINMKVLPKPKVVFRENNPFFTKSNNNFENFSTKQLNKNFYSTASTFSSKTSGFMSSRSFNTKSKTRMVRIKSKSTFKTKPKNTQ